MVKLYDPELDEIEMYETTSGRWVKKSDYAALEAENKNMKQLLIRSEHILDNLLVPSEEATSEFGKEFCILSKDIKQVLNNEDR